jgi:hypothetical protein
MAEVEYQNTNDLFEGDLIQISENPKNECWKFVPLFKEGTGGEIRVWQVGFLPNENNLKMVHGILITTKGENGQLITATHPITENKSGRSLQQQALLEARKRYLDQYSSGYLPKGEELPVELNGTEPMLAKTLKLGNEKCKSNEVKITNYPVSVMAKYDGIRCLSRCLPDGSVQTRSRNNKPHEAPLTHIKEELKNFLKYLPFPSELDGELYSLDMGFDELSGVIRTKKRKHLKHDLVKFYIFDLIEPKNLCWEERYRVLVEAFTKYLEDGNTCHTFQIIQTYTVNNEKELLEFHDKFVFDGFEGIIIRKYGCVEVNKCCLQYLSTPERMCKKCEKGYKLTIYRSKRTNALIKYKMFQDEEAIIMDFSKGIGTEEGAIEYIVKDVRGNILKLRPKGTMEERRRLYQEGKTLIGKKVTIRYQELSKDNIPRFPLVVCIRDYE